MNPKFRNADLHTLTMQLEGMSKAAGSCKIVFACHNLNPKSELEIP